MAYPSKLTPELQRDICTLIRAGNWAYVACEAVGIHRSTLWKWLQYGRNARDRGERNKYRAFMEAVEKAESEGEVLFMEKLRKAVDPDDPEDKPDIGIVKWWLMHRFPGRWGLQQSRQEISGLGAGPITLKVIRAVPRPEDDRDDPGHQEDIHPEPETS